MESNGFVTVFILVLNVFPLIVETSTDCGNGDQQSLEIAKEFPHMALLGYEVNNDRIRYACHGILVGPTLVLTLSFCVQPYGVQPKTVRLGISCRSQQISNIKRIIYHTRKTKENVDHVVIIKFEPAARLNDFVRPLRATISNIKTGQSLTSAMWIRNIENGDAVYHVEKRLSLVIDQAICEKQYCLHGTCLIGIDNATSVSANSIFCANYYNHQPEDPRKVELGVVHMTENGTVNVAGILVNTMEMVDVHNPPKLYLRVGKYSKWIEYIIRRY